MAGSVENPSKRKLNSPTYRFTRNDRRVNVSDMSDNRYLTDRIKFHRNILSFTAIERIPVLIYGTFNLLKQRNRLGRLTRFFNSKLSEITQTIQTNRRKISVSILESYETASSFFSSLEYSKKIIFRFLK